MTTCRSHARRFAAFATFRRYLQEARGAAAAEFVLWLAVVIVPILSVVDLGVFAFQRMQLDLAGQAAVQAAWHVCDDGTKLPATTKCAGLSDAILVAAQSTSLGDGVTVDSGSPVEGYFCANGSNTLTQIGSTWTVGETPPDSRPACAGSATPAGDYIQVTVKYTYVPVFTGVSIASLLAGEKTRTAWMRLS